MCGIVGSLVFGNSNYRVTEPYIVAMRDTMIHRGPDGARVWIGDNERIGFGHPQFAILELLDAAAN